MSDGHGSPGLDPIKATVDAYQTVKHLLATLKTLDQKMPQVIEALSLIAQLQQDIAEVSARNSQLERELVQAERREFELSKQVQSEEAWRAQLEKLEKCQTAHGRWAFREKGTESPLYCAVCINNRKLIFLQVGTHKQKLIDRYRESEFCPVCATSY